MSVAKVLVKPVGFLEIIEMAEPINDLAESVFETVRPFFRRFLADLLEYGGRVPVFEFYETEPPLPVAEDDIRSEIPEDLKFVGDLLGDTDSDTDRVPDVSSEMQRCLQELLDLPLAENLLRVQEITESIQFRFELDVIERDLREVFCHQITPDDGPLAVRAASRSDGAPPTARIVSKVVMSMTVRV